MQRPTPWLMLVVLLLGLLFLREERVQHWDDAFLRWLLDHSRPPQTTPVPLTVVEVGVDSLGDSAATEETGTRGGRPATVSPLEFALFLQSAMEFHPEVIAFENILKWRERDKDQEQVFLDQAMRVPKLLLGAELTSTPDPDAPAPEVHSFGEVKGKHGELAAFSGVGRQPGEDMRLISTLSFVNLPDDISSDLRVPLLFLYRGEVIPSFALQAVLLWMRVTPAEVKVELGSHILLPNGRKIPISVDGTMLIHRHAATTARRVTLNELLLATQQREAGTATDGANAIPDLHDQIVLVRTPANPLAPPDVFAATIATMQGDRYLHRVSRIFDLVFLLALVAAIPLARQLDRADLVLCGIAITAGYCLVAVGLVSAWQLWLPAYLPLGGLWLVIVTAIVVPRDPDAARSITVTIPPPIP